MTDTFASVNGQRITAAQLLVSNVGPWVLDCDFEGEPVLSGLVEVVLGTLKLAGTLVETQTGTFGLQLKGRIVGGNASWGKTVAAKDYHNDAGVKARLIAEDVAREVGERLGTFADAPERVGIDYVRPATRASSVIETVAGRGVAWWVDFAGVTQVGKRIARVLDKSAYEVLFYDPRTNIATIALDDPAAMFIGATISERLDTPKTVRDYTITLDGDRFHVTAWCGGSTFDRGRLAGLLAELAESAAAKLLFGKYRYRVLRMLGDRVELQAVRHDAGLPDILPVALWPGVPGVETVLSSGAEVLVEFVEGDRTMPIVTHFAGKNDGGAAFVPVSLTLCGSTQRVARQGDLVQSGGPGTAVILTPLPTAAPSPFVTPLTPYLISFSIDPLAVGPRQAPLYGAISTGSPKVKA